MTRAVELAQVASLGVSEAFKNRIINGAMVIDQRNAGASGTANDYTVDRFAYYGSQASKGTWQQNAGSVTPPAGFVNYLGFTSSSAYSITSTDIFDFYQRIEGNNVSDLAWGTANAKTVTLSFWVYSSLTGTFGGALLNNAQTRSYPFTYTISAANTWQQISITIAGDTSGSWAQTTGYGIQIGWGLGIGSTYSGTAGAWASATYYGATGATSVVGTNGATFYITGVQLEVGSSATGFEYVNYQTSLANCQRYYYLHASGNSKVISLGSYYNTTSIDCAVPYKVSMRTTPTVVQTTGTDYYSINRNGGSDTFNSFDIADRVTTETIQITVTANISGTAGQVGLVVTNNASASLAFSAEL